MSGSTDRQKGYRATLGRKCNMMKWVIAAGLILAAPFAASAQDAEAGKAVFKKCSACHAFGKNALGPNLTCVFRPRCRHRRRLRRLLGCREEVGRHLGRRKAPRMVREGRCCDPRQQDDLPGRREGRNRPRQPARLHQERVQAVSGRPFSVSFETAAGAIRWRFSFERTCAEGTIRVIGHSCLPPHHEQLT